jgi:arabinose-5-phosphate isomerase
MSNARLGHLIIEQNKKLAGVFSDGDLRRSLMSKDFDINKNISNYMTKEPFFIEDDNILAVDALKLIESKKIQLLIVANRQKEIIGAIHIHNLIEAGIDSETK